MLTCSIRGSIRDKFCSKRKTHPKNLKHMTQTFASAADCKTGSILNAALHHRVCVPGASGRRINQRRFLLRWERGSFFNSSPGSHTQIAPRSQRMGLKGRLGVTLPACIKRWRAHVFHPKRRGHQRIAKAKSRCHASAETRPPFGRCRADGVRDAQRGRRSA